MTKLDRLTAKVFADNAPADEIGQFGSALSGTKVLTSDVATIQALPAYTSGWGSAVISNRNYPTMQEFNGLLKVMSYQSAYTLQQGIPEYDSGTVYYIGSIVKSLDADNNAVLYQSVADNNINNQLTNTDYWKELQLGGGSGASRNIGEIVCSALPLTDAGLHLLDGTLLSGSGIYSAFVSYIADLYEDLSYTLNSTTSVVGSPTYHIGVASNFSTSNYYVTPTFTGGSASWEINIRFTTAGDVTTKQYLIQKGSGYNVALAIENGKLVVSMSSDGSTWDIAEDVASGSTIISANTEYYAKIATTASGFEVTYSTDGTTYSTAINVPSASTIYDNANLQIGGNSSGNAFDGSIDLHDTNIYSNGSAVWTALVAQTANGFCSEADWQTALATYGSCGKFVYDSVNNTVRLPKVSNILQSTTDLSALGDLVEAGLPNITGSIGTPSGNNTAEKGIMNSSTARGAFSANSYTKRGFDADSTSSTYMIGFSFDASRSNSIYGNSSTVQPQTVRVLVYIVVATSTKTDIQVDIDEIATDLNGKADVDLTNVNDAGTSLAAGWSMPSSTYDDLTLGSSGSSYTAPANGWFILRGNSTTTNGWISILNRMLCNNPLSFQGGGLNAFVPASKGDSVNVSYSGFTKTYFRFYYAKGSESEAS